MPADSQPSVGEDEPGPELALEPADIFFTKGTSLVARLIRRFTTKFGEERSSVNHVGIVVSGGDTDTAVIVEALSSVKKHRFVRYRARTRTAVAVYRPLDLTETEIRSVVDKALEYEGRRYGYRKIVAHFLDWALQGAYFFRRLTNDDRYPICSWVIAYAFERARPRFFGIDPGAADPDDLWDWVTEHPQSWKRVRALEPLTS